MIKYSLIILFILLTGCDEYNVGGGLVGRTSSITKILDCTDESTGVASVEGLSYKGTGIIEGGGTYHHPGKCRVEFENGLRATVKRPLAIGDIGMFARKEWVHHKEGKDTTTYSDEFFMRMQE